MKNNKQGFSLAEVLIASAIAAIIATIGFTIAKKGVAKAYDLYVYSGYNAISLALSDAANNKNLKLSDCAENLSTNACKFTKHIYTVLSGRNETVKDNGFEFDTPNKIHYRIYYYGYIKRVDENAIPEYRIFMEVPSVKTKTSNTKSICMSFLPGSSYKNFLIPFSNDSKDPTCNKDNMIPDIDSRKDLLTFYLEDGKRGKKIGNTYYPRYFRSAKEALCRVYNNQVDGGSLDGTTQTLIDCTNNPMNSTDYKDFEVSDPANIIILNTDPRRL